MAAPAGKTGAPELAKVSAPDRLLVGGPSDGAAGYGDGGQAPPPTAAPGLCRRISSVPPVQLQTLARERLGSRTCMGGQGHHGHQPRQRP